MGLKLRKVDGVWHAYGVLAGKRIRKSLRTEIKSVAEEMRLKMETNVVRGRAPMRKETLRDACVLYLRAKQVSKRSEQDVWRLATGLGHTPLDDLTGEVVWEWIDEEMEGTAPATRRKLITMANAVTAFAAQRGWCEPLRMKRPRDGEGRDRWLTSEEIESLLLATPEHLWPMFVFLVNTGARLGEAVALDWNDIREAPVGWEVVLRSRKGDGMTRQRSVPLNAKVMEALREQARINSQNGVPLAKRRGPVFRHSFGGRWSSASAVSCHMPGIVKRAGLRDVTMHDLRRTFASHLVQKGVNLRAIAELLGHTSLAMVMRYAHLAPSAHRTAVDLL